MTDRVHCNNDDLSFTNPPAFDESILRALVEGTAGTIGDDFFYSMTRWLAYALQARYAFITECVDDECSRVRTLAFWMHDDFARNLEYDLENTICQRVIDEGVICFYQRDVQALFPSETALARLKVQSYLGIPLQDSAGRILGHIAVLDTEPMPEHKRDLWILKIFAARAAAELERKRIFRDLAASETRYRQLFETNPLPAVVCDRFTLQILAANDAAAVHYGYARDQFERMSLHQIQASSGQPKLSQILKEASPTSGLNIVWGHVRPDSITAHVKLTWHSLSYSGREALLVLANDISARLKTEHERDQAVEDERRRLARDLHDSVIQSWYSLTLFAEASRKSARSGRIGETNLYLNRLTDTAQQALMEMRRIVYELGPLALEKEGLVGALRRRLEMVEAGANIQPQFIAEYLVRLSPEVELGLYHIAQEALNNVLRHASASAVTVHLIVNRDKINLSISDNGRGFDLRGVRRGMGLNNMKERAERLGGHFKIMSNPALGSRVEVELRTSRAG